jgi:glycosyltransferase involved in cell wall biosynthesis
MNRIAYIQYTNPAAYPPLEHSSRILADDGWRVLVLGIRVRGIELFRFPAHDNITFRQLPICSPGWRQKFHYARFVAWAMCGILVSGSSWAYASDPFACPVGLLLSFVPGMRVLYHEHDSPALNGSGRDSGVSRFMRFVLWTRRVLARRATLCLLPNEGRANLFTKDVGAGAKTICVWNCPSRSEVAAPRPESNNDDLWVHYHGSLTPSCLPATILYALSMLPEQVKFRAVGYETMGHSGYAAQLRALADQLSLAQRVEFLGAMPRAALLTRCRQADVGLALMPKTNQNCNEQTMTGASNKPFDYLACGLALLVSDLPEWHALYVNDGCALAVDPDDAASIAAALRWLLEHPNERRAMGERGRQRVLTEWNYERQFAPVLKYLQPAGISAMFTQKNASTRNRPHDQSEQRRNPKSAVSKL